MYNAIYNDDLIQLASKYVGSFTPFTIKKEALKLKGVRNFKIIPTEAEKLEFITRIYTDLYTAMTMVFVN